MMPQQQEVPVHHTDFYNLYTKLYERSPLGIVWIHDALGLNHLTCMFYGMPEQFESCKSPPERVELNMWELSKSVGLDVKARKIPVWVNASVPPYSRNRVSALAWGVDTILWYGITYSTGREIIDAILKGETKKRLETIHAGAEVVRKAVFP